MYLCVYYVYANKWGVCLKGVTGRISNSEIAKRRQRRRSPYDEYIIAAESRKQSGQARVMVAVDWRIEVSYDKVIF